MNLPHSTTPMTQDDTILYYMLFNHEYVSLPMVNYAKTHFGWTALQFTAIAYLKRAGKLSMSELAHILFVSKQQAAQLVSSLVKHGLARRVQSEANRRVIFVSLTETAVEKLMETKNFFIETVKEKLLSHPGTEMNEIVSAMNTIVSFVQQHGEELSLLAVDEE